MTFCFKFIYFIFLSLCLCSSRCPRLSVRWERRSPNIRRPWHSVCTGVGTKCSWGSSHTWFCSGCICLLALFSTAWWELCPTHIQYHICWPLRIFHARCSIWSDYFSRALCGKCVCLCKPKQVSLLQYHINLNWSKRKLNTSLLIQKIAQPLKFVPYAWF